MFLVEPHPPAALTAYIRRSGRLPSNWALYANGRSALAAVAEHEHLRPNDVVYMPALHCPSMVDPFTSRAATVRYYPITKELAADTKWLAEDAVERRVRFVLGVHFFGFPCPGMHALRSLSDDLGATFIEDCAHMLPGLVGDPFDFMSGHWRISSPHKFLGTGEGGLLVAGPDRALPESTPDAGIISGCRIALREMQRRKTDRRRIGVQALNIAETMYRALRRSTERLNQTRNDAVRKSVVVEPISTIGRRAVTNPDLPYIARQRSRIAQRLRHAFPDHVYRQLTWPTDPFTPYVLPIYHQRADQLTAELRSRGISVLRFGHHRHWTYSSGNFPTADELSACLVQLPCHQELSDLQVDAMIVGVRESLHALG